MLILLKCAALRPAWSTLEETHLHQALQTPLTQKQSQLFDVLGDYKENAANFHARIVLPSPGLFATVVYWWRWSGLVAGRFIMDNPVLTRQALTTQLSEEEREKEVEFVHAELVAKIRAKFNCCLVDWILLIVCAKSKSDYPCPAGEGRVQGYWTDCFLGLSLLKWGKRQYLISSGNLELLIMSPEHKRLECHQLVQ